MLWGTLIRQIQQQMTSNIPQKKSAMQCPFTRNQGPIPTVHWDHREQWIVPYRCESQRPRIIGRSEQLLDTNYRYTTYTQLTKQTQLKNTKRQEKKSCQGLSVQHASCHINVHRPQAQHWCQSNDTFLDSHLGSTSQDILLPFLLKAQRIKAGITMGKSGILSITWGKDSVRCSADGTARAKQGSQSGKGQHHVPSFLPSSSLYPNRSFAHALVILCTWSSLISSTSLLIFQSRI